MVDYLGMDPARIERLRSPERLEYFDPDLIWDALKPKPECTLVDIGAGVGFIALPFAKRYPMAKVYGCDILDGMIGLLREGAAAQALENVEGIVMTPNSVDLPDGVADVVVMAQLHHELDTPELLLAECKRLLADDGIVAIIDWKDEENGKSPPVGRRVPEAVMRTQLTANGFLNIESHDLYEFHTVLTGRA
jgi:ubiquinone/menaquinone biosynthesis C-methylase UbiE